MFPVNLGRFGNSIAIWLGIQPYELFFYIFLPPLLFDAAVRIDFYLFKQVEHRLPQLTVKRPHARSRSQQRPALCCILLCLLSPSSHSLSLLKSMQSLC